MSIEKITVSLLYIFRKKHERRLRFEMKASWYVLKAIWKENKEDY